MPDSDHRNPHSERDVGWVYDLLGADWKIDEDQEKTDEYTSSLNPTTTVFPARTQGDRRFPVGPSIASTTAFGAFPPGANSVTFLPLETMTFEACFASAAASDRPSFLLAETISFGLIFLASRNLDAFVQDVQPLRW